MFRLALKKDEIKINPYISSRLIDHPDCFFLLSEYVLSTNRFSHLKTFLDDSDD